MAAAALRSHLMHWARRGSCGIGLSSDSLSGRPAARPTAQGCRLGRRDGAGRDEGVACEIQMREMRKLKGLEELG